ncbi:MAG TPA: hypothetical protein VD813_12825 [Pseudonocardia sp.]|nr:hypothetical protein [Pseudonocardia sp.]
MSTIPIATLRPRRALGVLLAVITIVVLDVLIGGAWDAEYHRTQPFDGFFSPPHIFIYTWALVAMALVLRLCLSPSLRYCFGPSMRIPGIRVPFPGALVVLAAGTAGIAVAGPLDAIWHTAFGLDETNWSFPHALLGFSLAVLAVGALACRIQLARLRPMWPITPYVLGYLAAVMTGVFLGPLQRYPTPGFAQASGSVGALADDADHQHLVRIVTEANLTHTNPAYVVLAALWCGLVIGFLRALDARPRYWLLLGVLVGVGLLSGARDDAERYGLLADQAVATGTPLLTAVIAFALAAKLPENGRFAVAGAAFAVHCWLVWGPAGSPVPYGLAALTAPLAAVAGAAVGRGIQAVVARPAERTTWLLVVIALVGLPALTGSVDLALRIAIE